MIIALPNYRVELKGGEHSLEGRMIDSRHEIYFGRDSTNFAPAKFSGRVSAAEVVAARRCWREFN